MTAYVKSEDGIITEIYGLITKPLRHGDEVQFPFNKLKGVGYHEVVGKTSSVVWFGVSKGLFEERIALPQHPKIPDLRDGKVFFRFHRGSWFDSLATAVEVYDVNHLREIIIESDGEFLKPGGSLSIARYGIGDDPRIGWKTFRVSWNNSIIGFLSGELK